MDLLRENITVGNINWFTMLYKKESRLVGEVYEDSFKISHTVRTNNANYPIIIGKYIDFDNGYKISVRMRPSWPSLIFNTLFFVLTFMFLFLIFMYWALLVTALMYCLLILLGYKNIASKSRKKLVEIFSD